MISEQEALTLWYRALEQPLGLAIRTDNQRSLMSRLYHVRAREGDEDLYALQCLLAQDPEWVFLKRIEFSEIRPVTEADLDSL